MSFKKIAAIVLTAGASVAFAGVANAGTSSVGSNYQATIPSVCSIAYNTAAANVAMSLNAAGTQLSASRTYNVVCNVGSATLSYATSGSTYNTAPLPTFATSSLLVAGSTSSDFASTILPAGTLSSSTTSSNSVVTVAAEVNSATPGAALPGGNYNVPITLTLTF